MKPNEVLKSVTETLRISVSALTVNCGLSRDRLHNIIQGKVKTITGDVADAIVRVYPQFSRTWLMTGEGNMLNPGYKVVPATLTDELTPAQVLDAISWWSNDNLAEIARKSGISKGNLSSIHNQSHRVKNISHLNAQRICDAYPELSMHFVERGVGPMLKDGRMAKDVLTTIADVNAPMPQLSNDDERVQRLENQVQQLLRAVNRLTQTIYEKDGSTLVAESKPQEHEI